MITKVLIANRGAIAVRICRTLREMGVASVAVYAEDDAGSLHVGAADEAFCLGAGAARDTYLDQERIIAIAQQTGAQAIHPGYGFLSENATFVARCEEAGLIFLGPTVAQIEQFGLKHTARALAEASAVPLLPGSGLLQTLDEAVREAERIGYPVMLKSTAGGGGIGMQICHSSSELAAAYDSVKRLGENNFANGGLFLEKCIQRARHIEVQVFGDGRGDVVALGERDCSAQRRNQKVVEEAPAPNLPDTVRAALHATAVRLMKTVCYRSAGTVEFILDQDTNRFYFLEVNTRLQVEHGVTEAVYGVDIVRWMVELGAGRLPDLPALSRSLQPQGHAIQVRLYAEDPGKDFQPCAGLLTEVVFPAEGAWRIDRWVEAGVEVPAWFDPMLAKVIVHAQDRDAAIAQLLGVLDATRLYGIETNLGYVRDVVDSDVFRGAHMVTRFLNGFRCARRAIDVLSGGTMTTVQDFPGRTGYWAVGVPPSGPFDDVSFRLANHLLENAADAAALEFTLNGPTLRFQCDTTIALAGAPMDATLDGEPLAFWQAQPVRAGQVLKVGRISGAGARAYLAVKGGIDCPTYLGSRATFTLGQFGGHAGRALQAGDVLRLFPQTGEPVSLAERVAGAGEVPAFSNTWTLHVIYGPHGAPDFFTANDIDTFFSTAWEVHYNSSRTGIRLLGPKPEWARSDGGEAGMHPSNIHDNAYAIGTIDFTGDMPVILGPDGPSLGGFVCPATVISADLWKLGQLKAGDKVQFVAVTQDAAVMALQQQTERLGEGGFHPPTLSTAEPVNAVLAVWPAGSVTDVDIHLRASGDANLLVEFGPLMLDIELRFRAHALMLWLEAHPLPGTLDITPGIRSLQVHYDPLRVTQGDIVAHVRSGLTQQSSLDTMQVPARIVHLPLSWNDEACQLAVQKYMQSVRADAPWCPDNIEFIRRINGLVDVDAVKRIVFDASYLVMGLGDVYLGAPVATPVDPRHRLVTTKYNPARTWTAENSVGIGGSYLCIYGMEGPGGYQFVGRTVQMWNRYRTTTEFDKPWLLEFFDQIRFHEVSASELQRARRDFPCGRYPITIEHTHFSLAEYRQSLQANALSIAAFTQQRERAFAAELQRWVDSGQMHFSAASEEGIAADELVFAEGEVSVDSGVSGNVWELCVKPGDTVHEGQVLLVMESMKMEIPVLATTAGTVQRVLRDKGQSARAGQPLLVLKEA